MNAWEYDTENKVWRANFISTIENKWLRRLALCVSLPLFLAYWFIGTLFMAACVMIAAPFYMFAKSWPRVMFSSFALRWNTPKPKDGGA